MNLTNPGFTISKEKIEYINHLLCKGGPDSEDVFKFTEIVNNLDEEDFLNFRNLLKEALDENTLIGHGYVKPYGYPGDFVIINNIYRQYINPDPIYHNWDRFFQEQSGARAVRNRKDFFHRYCAKLENSERKEVKVLILGSGPATDVMEYLDKVPGSKIRFDLIDFDQNAIDFAKMQTQKFNGSVEYFRINVLRYKPFRMYDLIWSAGLFDYFKDKHFVYMIKKYYTFLADGGECIIGNFSKINPTKKLMEVLSDWYLNHRSNYDLIRLAVEAKVSEENISIDQEELGVNLFLRLKKSQNGIYHREEE